MIDVVALETIDVLAMLSLSHWTIVSLGVVCCLDLLAAMDESHTEIVSVNDDRVWHRFLTPEDSQLLISSAN